MKGCTRTELVGDGYCNDEVNNIHCNFDGGDCCYSFVNKAFCTDCVCLTGNTGLQINYQLIGDGYCNDEINSADYNYDGGDCCVNVQTFFCRNCTCHFPETCEYGPLATFGDGICNDETNNAECSYDQGDCCLTNANTDYCSECLCSINGVITSPGFPHKYNNNLELTWLIQLPLGNYIKIDFLSFDLEDHMENDCQ